MGKVCVIGSLNMDLSIMTTKMPQAGETVMGSDFQMLPGGKGLNQAIAAARLGSEVSLIGAIGADAFGQALQAFLQTEKLACTGLQIHPEVATGTATIILEQGENRIIIYPGANATVTPEVVRTQRTLVQASDIIVAQLEIPQASIEVAFQIAKSAQKVTIFNPAPIQKVSETLWTVVDILVVNESECQQLTGIQVSTFGDAEQAIAKLRLLGIKQIVITLGGNGVYFHDGKHCEFRPAQKVPVVDTTGAGDTFIGALASAISEKMAFSQAVEYAIQASALAVTKRGAATAIPTQTEVMEFMQP